MSQKQEIKEISPAEFFSRYRELVGFQNPARALYVSLREAFENSIESCVDRGIRPRIEIFIEQVAQDLFKLVVRDNGPGVRREDIPKAFGRFLTSVHYVFKQSQGILGVGIKGAILYAQNTSGQPAIIESSVDGKESVRVTLEIDTKSNTGRIHNEEVLPAKQTGTTVELLLRADFQRAKDKIIEYLSQTAIVSPYAEIHFLGPDGTKFDFVPVSKELPVAPKEMKPHPYGVDVGVLKDMSHATKRGQTATSFLTNGFQKVGRDTALKVLNEAGIEPGSDPSKFSVSQMAKISSVLRTYKFHAPSAECLSPVTAGALISGLKAAVSPEWLDAIQRPPSAYSGFPFVITVGMAFGGESPGVRLRRYSNRIPLLYDEGSDVAKKILDGFDWRRYKVDAAKDCITVAVSLVSVRVPFKTAGKEYVADVPEIEREIDLALKELARRLGLFLSKKMKRQEQQRRTTIFEQYLPLIARDAGKLAGAKRVPSVKSLLEAPKGEER